MDADASANAKPLHASTPDVDASANVVQARTRGLTKEARMKIAEDEAVRLFETFPKEAQLCLGTKGAKHLLQYKVHMCPEYEKGRKCWRGRYCTYAHGQDELLMCSVAERIRAAGKAMLELGAHTWWQNQDYETNDKQGSVEWTYNDFAPMKSSPGPAVAHRESEVSTEESTGKGRGKLHHSRGFKKSVEDLRLEALKAWGVALHDEAESQNETLELNNIDSAVPAWPSWEEVEATCEVVEVSDDDSDAETISSEEFSVADNIVET